MKFASLTYFKIRVSFVSVALIASCMVSCSTKIVQVKHETAQYKFSSKENSAIDSSYIPVIEPYKSGVEKEMSQVIGHSEMPMDKGTPEGLLGNFVADLCMNVCKKYFSASAHDLDFCFLNNGGLRATLPKGEITKGHIYSLMPFENELVIITIDGNTAEQLFTFIAGKGGMPVSGLKMGIENNKPVNILINEIPFDKNKKYRVLTSDYLANGGDNLEFLKQAKHKEELSIKVREAIILHIADLEAQGKKISSVTDGRIYKKQP